MSYKLLPSTTLNTITHGNTLSFSGTSICTTGTLSITPQSWKAWVTNTWVDQDFQDYIVSSRDQNQRIRSGHSQIEKGTSVNIALPDGSILVVDSTGNYHVDDSNAKVIYKANRNKEFNAYLNASDLLAKFISYVGRLGITQSELLTLPLGLFINWLIIEAASADGDPVPEDVIPISVHPLLKSKMSPRCLYCQRFIRRGIAKRGFTYCSTGHAAKFLAKLEVTI